MDYRWEEESEIELLRTRKAKRYLITPMGGYFPVLLKLQNGDLLAVVRGGDYHMGERGCLDAVRSQDGGKSWSRATPIAHEGPDDRNPAAVQLSDGTTLVAFARLDIYANGKSDPQKRKDMRGKQSLFLSRSEDGGHTWAGEQPMEGLPAGMCSPFGKMVQLPSGTVLCAVYGLDDSGTRDDHSFIYRSTDGGRTWGDPTLVGVPFNETTLLRLPSGKLLAALRGYDVSAVWLSESADEGYTWSEPAQVTQAGEHPGDLLLLPSGKVLLTYGRRRRPYGVRALVSHDEGRSWDHDHTISLAADSDTTDCGYPSSALLEDKTICTAYYSVENRQVSSGWGIHAALVRYTEGDILP